MMNHIKGTIHGKKSDSTIRSSAQSGRNSFKHSKVEGPKKLHLHTNDGDMNVVASAIISRGYVSSVQLLCSFCLNNNILRVEALT